MTNLSDFVLEKTTDKRVGGLEGKFDTTTYHFTNGTHVTKAVNVTDPSDVRTYLTFENENGSDRVQ